ncbi:MAG: hypothetical protein RJQ09_11860 [Cyclobacteriaceae bacterium]
MRSKLKLSFVPVVFLSFLVSVNSINAQDITDEDLMKYAVLDQVIDLMKKDLSAEVNNLIRNQEGMTGQRYKELAQTKGDETKLAEIEAKDYEIQFLKLIDDLKDERTEAIKLVNQELATKMVGDRGKTYKSIKSALGSNPDVKARYEEISASISSETP